MLTPRRILGIDVVFLLAAAIGSVYLWFVIADLLGSNIGRAFFSGVMVALSVWLCLSRQKNMKKHGYPFFSRG